MADRGQQLRLDLDAGARSRQGHASRACYIAGCREVLCKAANAHYQRDYRNGLRGKHAQRMGPYRLDNTP